MKIHKNIFIIGFNENKFAYLNNVISKIKQDLLEVKFDNNISLH